MSPFEYKTSRRVEFSDTDMAGIAHFSAFFRFMESVEHEFIRSIGYSIHTEIGGRKYGWPRVQADCRFTSPLRFEDEVEIHLVVREKRSKSIRYEFMFRKRDGDRVHPVAHGSITVVCTAKEGDGGGRMKGVNIPKEISDRIEVAPVDFEIE